MFEYLSDVTKNLIKDKKTRITGVLCSLYFIIGMYGFYTYDDFLFWLN